MTTDRRSVTISCRALRSSKKDSVAGRFIATMGFLEKLFPKRRSQYEGDKAGLVQALHALALADNAENRKKMYEVLLTSTLLIPTSEEQSTPSGPMEHNRGVELQLHWVTD